MSAIDIFFSSVNYKYKSRICSITFLVVYVFILLSLLTPIVIINNSGGSWLKNRVYVLKPHTVFQYKYLLLMETDNNTLPISCTSFSTYKENRIPDDCVLIKVQELDVDSDDKNDIFKFSAQFYTRDPIRTVKLLLFFNFDLQDFSNVKLESIAVFDYMINRDIKKLKFLGDLELQQRGLVHRNGLHDIYDQLFDLADYTLDELLEANANRKFFAKISNTQVTWQTGFTADEVVQIDGQLFYGEIPIRYQPGLFEELKWAWMQYLALFVVFFYIIRYVLKFLLTRRYLNSYIVVPWKDKQD